MKRYNAKINKDVKDCRSVNCERDDRCQECKNKKLIISINKKLDNKKFLTYYPTYNPKYNTIELKCSRNHRWTTYFVDKKEWYDNIRCNECYLTSIDKQNAKLICDTYDYTIIELVYDQLTYKCKNGHTHHNNYTNDIKLCSSENDSYKDMTDVIKNIVKSYNGKLIKITDDGIVEYNYHNITYNKQIGDIMRPWYTNETRYRTYVITCYFQKMFNDKFNFVSPKWLEGLHIDGYSKINKLCFVHNDEHTFLFTHHKTIADLNKQLEQTKRIKELCNINHTKLISIPYYIRLENIQSYIINECERYNIIIPDKTLYSYESFNKLYINTLLPTNTTHKSTKNSITKHYQDPDELFVDTSSLMKKKFNKN